MMHVNVIVQKAQIALSNSEMFFCGGGGGGELLWTFSCNELRSDALDGGFGTRVAMYEESRNGGGGEGSDERSRFPNGLRIMTPLANTATKSTSAFT